MEPQEWSKLCISPFSNIYVCLYGTLGLWLSLRNLQKNFGRTPIRLEPKHEVNSRGENVISIFNPMIDHDLKIIGTLIGIMQYACLLTACLTRQPSLFLPHFGGQLITIFANIMNTMLLLPTFLGKGLFGKKFSPSVLMRCFVTITRWFTAISVMSFSYSQQYCVFRQ